MSISSSYFSDHMVSLAHKDFCNRMGLASEYETQNQVSILRNKRGKPYFDGQKGIYFSVSHSGDWWGCLMADEEVGFDLEVIRFRANFEKIAERFFTAEEAQYVRCNGLAGFYDIWVRKEAYVKFLGTGLSEGLGSFSVATKDRLLAEVSSQNGDSAMRNASCRIGSCEASSDLCTAYCCESGSKILQMINLMPDSSDTIRTLCLTE